MSDQLKYLKVPLLTACLSEKIMDGEKEKKNPANIPQTQAQKHSCCEL
jgi:hypothetical protein